MLQGRARSASLQTRAASAPHPLSSPTGASAGSSARVFAERRLQALGPFGPRCSIHVQLDTETAASRSARRRPGAPRACSRAVWCLRRGAPADARCKCAAPGVFANGCVCRIVGSSLRRAPPPGARAVRPSLFYPRAIGYGNGGVPIRPPPSWRAARLQPRRVVLAPRRTCRRALRRRTARGAPAVARVSEGARATYLGASEGARAPYASCR